MNIIICIVYVFGFITGSLFAFTAWGQGMPHRSHPPQDMPLHERFYSGWMMPDNPTRSCCNQMDCYPTEAKFEGGRWWAKRREDGAWIMIPESKIERTRDMPDARAHLCAPPPSAGGPQVFCFGAGAGG